MPNYASGVHPPPSVVKPRAHATAAVAGVTSSIATPGPLSTAIFSGDIDGSGGRIRTVAAASAASAKTTTAAAAASATTTTTAASAGGSRRANGAAASAALADACRALSSASSAPAPASTCGVRISAYLGGAPRGGGVVRRDRQIDRL